MPIVREVFAGGNGPKGFYNLFGDIFPPQGKRLYLLKGGPGTGKSSLMRRIVNRLCQEGLEVECYLCGSDPRSLDAVYAPQLGVGLMDATAPHVRDPKYPGLIDQIVPLGEHWDGAILKNHREEILRLSDGISAGFARAGRYLSACAPLQAELAHSSAVAYPAEQKQADTLDLLQGVLSCEGARPGPVRHFMGSAIAYNGWENHLDALAALPRRFLLRSSYAGGWSDALHALEGALARAGIEAVAYRNPLEPDTIVHIEVPGAGVAVLTSCPRHHFAQRAGDVEYTLPQSRIDTNFAADTQDALLREAAACLRTAMQLHDELEAVYAKAMDFSKNDALAQRLIEEILG